MRRILFILPALLFIALAGYFAVALRSGDPESLPSALIDKPVPSFDLAGLGGGAGFSRSALEGQVALINVFASWCVPCHLEHPILLRLSEEEHLPVYGIDYKDKPEDLARFLAQLGDPYRRIGLDRDGRVGIDFGVYKLPETFVIDRQGRIRYRIDGPITADIVDKELLPLVKKLGRS
jgi:cytochrome c biogenesis protein CcmG/thiol:disulfide interchange protein DsbE